MFQTDTKSVLISHVDWLKILILGVEGVLVMHGQLMEDLVLKSNLLMANLMQLSMPILVTIFVKVEVVNLPLLKDAALHGGIQRTVFFQRKVREPCLLVKQFLKTHVVKCITAVSREMMLYSAECCALRQEDKHLEYSERAMLL